MKNATTPGASVIIITIIAAILLLGTGCQQKQDTNVTISPEPKEDINPLTGAPYQDIAEKRGVKTNITEFNELLRRASKIQSYKYNITDTATSDDQYRFYVLGRFVKIQLPELRYHSTGEEFDEILMERTRKIAFSHCGLNSCPKPYTDKELEKVTYDDYYMKDPLEYLYRVTQPVYLKQEMIGNDYTKVFSAKFEGNEARVWLQEYYGYPMKIIVKNPDGSKRTIKFEEMTIDATRSGEIDTPGNFTVKGEKGSWLFWIHYLGEWPRQGTNIAPAIQKSNFGA